MLIAVVILNYTFTIFLSITSLFVDVCLYIHPYICLCLYVSSLYSPGDGDLKELSRKHKLRQSEK